MKKGLFTFPAIFLMILMVTGCLNPRQDEGKWKVHLQRKDKRPYGTYLAYESLPFFFPSATITELSPGFRYDHISSKMVAPAGRSLLVAIGLDFYLSEKEMSRLFEFADAGNEVIIFMRQADKRFLRFIGYTLRDNGYEELSLTSSNDGAENLAALTIRGSKESFGYQGHSLLASFAPLPDSAYINQTKRGQFKHQFRERRLGFVHGKPDFIRFRVGRGHISLHAAPLVLSNYFLLQPGNVRYLQALWNTLPENISQIYWNEYFRRNAKASDLSVLLRYPATRWAFLLALTGMLIYLISQSKRRQRIQPEIKPLENNLVSFVEIVGRLYYNAGDHRNLAEKIIQHFLEWVRAHYYIQTNRLDADFAQHLSLRSEVPLPQALTLVKVCNEILSQKNKVEEEDLFHLHKMIEQFKKQ